MTGKFSQFQQLNRDPKKEARFTGKLLSKNIDVNRKVGMSADYPLKIDHYHQVYRNSRSLYEPHENEPEKNGGAGLSMSNTMHAYMCNNGKKEKP